MSSLLDLCLVLIPQDECKSFQMGHQPFLWTRPFPPSWQDSGSGSSNFVYVLEEALQSGW